MKSFVVDSSVACSWYFDEPWSVSARRWLEQCVEGEIELVVPRLHFLEVANVLRTRTRRRELEPDRALGYWELHLSAPLRVHDPALGAILARALELDATSYDVTYAALAEELDAPLLVAERGTRPWIERFGRRAIVVR